MVTLRQRLSQIACLSSENKKFSYKGFIKRVRKIAKNILLASWCLSVCPFAWKNKFGSHRADFSKI
jgi:hypothetical protein